MISTGYGIAALATSKEVLGWAFASMDADEKERGKSSLARGIGRAYGDAATGDMMLAKSDVVPKAIWIIDEANMARIGRFEGLS